MRLVRVGLLRIEWDNANQTLDAAKQRLSLPQFEHTHAVIAFGKDAMMCLLGIRTTNCSRHS